MYDAQEKALRDRNWQLAAARQEGEEKGRIEGKIKGGFQRLEGGSRGPSCLICFHAGVASAILSWICVCPAFCASGPTDRSVPPAKDRSEHNTERVDTTATIAAPRPMREIANIVSAKYGVPVTYEDPPFASPGDTEPLFPNSPTLGPREIREIVSLPASAAVGQVLNLAASHHNATGHGGRFAVVENAGVWGLVPTLCENSEGRLLKHDSLLDRRVSFAPQKDDTCGTVLKKLWADLSRRNPDLEILSGGFPLRLNLQVPYVRSEGSGRSATGRDILNDIVRIMNADLASQGWVLTWSMWYSPEPAGRKPMSAVDFQVVATHEESPVADELGDKLGQIEKLRRSQHELR